MFKVGDRVRIRDWDDMEREYGLDNNGSINKHNPTFVKTMRCLCGKYATISAIYGDSIELTDWSDYGSDVAWGYAKYMIEPVEKEECKQEETNVIVDCSGITIQSNFNNYVEENEREEKDMNKVLELYCEKAERTIENDYDEMIKSERSENPFVKEYNALINEFEAKMDDLYKREMDENGNHHVFMNNAYKYTYPFSIDITFTNENIKHYKEAKENELQDLDDFKQEVSAKLSLSDDLDYTLKVLKEYGIINKKTGKLESYFDDDND